MKKKRIAAVSFQCAGKLFDFDASDFELNNRDQVVVETERGKSLGTVIGSIREEEPNSGHAKLKAVLRKADEQDIEMAARNADREEESLKFCKKRVSERKMAMKLVRAEYLFDGSKIVFYFTADGRIDFRDLVHDLAQHFRTRIEMRQIGVRDEAKMVGGLGCCGRELCCSSYLRSFAPVSVKMAKAQGLALNPSKISGQCGRLLCCLGYEYETYNELRKNMPKCGKKLNLPDGPVEVISLNILAQKVTIADKDGRREVHIDDLNKPRDTTPTPVPKRATPAAAKPEKKDQKTTEEARQQRRPRRRGGRSNNPRKPEQQAQAEESKTIDNKKPAAPKVDKNTDEQKNTEQKPGRPRRRNRRRPRRRTDQGSAPKKSE
ncbi:MAG: stage 0 sporulation family protein [Geopsychrobacter sp.]|nr:stage 0 sporulation family protein [Geopsychrobacter sp.]